MNIMKLMNHPKHLMVVLPVQGGEDVAVDSGAVAAAGPGADGRNALTR